MEAVHSTGKTALKRKLEKEKAILKKKQTFWQRSKLHTAALFFTIVFFLFTNHWYFYLIPLFIHLVFMFWAYGIDFYTKRNMARAYRAYEIKYGIQQKDGSYIIPGHVKMTHRKLIEQGKPIPMY